MLLESLPVVIGNIGSCLGLGKEQPTVKNEELEQTGLIGPMVQYMERGGGHKQDIWHMTRSGEKVTWSNHLQVMKNELPRLPG